MYRDWPDDRSVLERHFGITRADGTPKPAFDVVRRRIEEIETDPTLAPIRIANRDDITAELLEGDGVPVRRRSGTSYDTIEVIPGRHEFEGPTFIEVSTEHPVCLIASVNGGRWAATHPHERTRSRLRLPIQPGADVERVTLMFTSSVYPMETRVTDIGLYSAEEGAAKP